MRLVKTTALALLLAAFISAAEVEPTDEQLAIEEIDEVEESPDFVEVGTLCQANQPSSKTADAFAFLLQDVNVPHRLGARELETEEESEDVEEEPDSVEEETEEESEDVEEEPDSVEVSTFVAYNALL